MHAGTQTTLEFDRVVEAVASHALTPLGTRELRQLRPLTDRRAVQAALAHTTEGVRFLAANEGGLPLEAPDDLAEILSRLAIEAHPLAPIDLRKLAEFLRSLERSCQAVRAAGGGPYPALTAIVDGSAAWTRECEDVERKIDAAGEVADDASPELKTIPKPPAQAAQPAEGEPRVVPPRPGDGPVPPGAGGHRAQRSLRAGRPRGAPHRHPRHRPRQLDERGQPLPRTAQHR